MEVIPKINNENGNDASMNMICTIGVSTIAGIGFGSLFGFLTARSLKKKYNLENLHAQRQLKAREDKLASDTADFVKMQQDLQQEYLDKTVELEESYKAKLADIAKKERDMERCTEQDLTMINRSRMDLAEKAVRLNDALEQISKTQTAQEAMDAARDLDIEGIMTSIMNF